MATFLADPDQLFGINQRLRQGCDFFFRSLQNVQRQPLRRFGANAGEMLKMLNQSSQRTGIDHAKF
jgi:hypothetical protein